MSEVGIKIGSQNTSVATRNEEGKIDIVKTKTCIRYPKGIIKKDNSEIKIGNDATEFADAKFPLRFGIVENDDGVAQLVDILGFFSLPIGANIVLASPAVQMKDGNERLTKAVKQVCSPKRFVAFSEGMCSATALSDVNFINTSAIFSLNLGSTTLEVGCFYEGNEIYLSAHPEVCGDRVDKSISNRISSVVGDAIISEKQLREMKENDSLINPKTHIIEGLTRNGKKEVQITDEITISLKEYAGNVASVFCNEIISAVNTTVRNVALKSPLFISGGMGNIEGMPEYIRDLIFEKMNHKFEILYSKDNNNHLIAAKGALLLCEEIEKEEI